ncbi:hypothetical protein D3C85_763740 [compost metagenome]
MRSVLVSVKYRYCWVANGRDWINGFGDDGLLAAGLNVRSVTAVAGLFLEVIVRHLPGLIGWPTHCRRTVTEYNRVFFQRVLGPCLGL